MLNLVSAPRTPRASRMSRAAALALAAAACVGTGNRAMASDHLDTPSVTTNPQADIGDLYAWTSYTGRQLNLVMTIVGHSFSDRLKYTFHIDSGSRFGHTTVTTLIECRFPAPNRTECSVGGAADTASGDASQPEGLYGKHRRFRVYAGTRDDPFFNNVKGTRAAYQVADTALHNGAVADAAGCAGFDSATSKAIFDQWGHTSGGPASNFLAGWTSSAIVISVDLPLVTPGGKIVAVWATTSVGSRQIDRAARPLTGNALLGTVASEEVSNRLKEEYNAATPRTAQFVHEIEQGLALYDAFDGKCGNQLLARKGTPSPGRYRALAAMLADDRLWVNTESTICLQLFAVELATLAGQSEHVIDCGGRTPLYNAANVYRSLLVDGTTTSVDDGVDRDDKAQSETVFPFLAAPAAPAPSAAPATSAAPPATDRPAAAATPGSAPTSDTQP